HARGDGLAGAIPPVLWPPSPDAVEIGRPEQVRIPAIRDRRRLATRATRVEPRPEPPGALGFRRPGMVPARPCTRRAGRGGDRRPRATVGSRASASTRPSGTPRAAVPDPRRLRSPIRGWGHHLMSIHPGPLIEGGICTLALTFRRSGVWASRCS
ncbi:MAG: hypothetical protein ACRDZO_06040, partial [Egibacteraceae bacterium]